MATGCSALAGAIGMVTLGSSTAVISNLVPPPTSQRPKSLLGLPRELRDTIWMLCLHHEQVKGPPHHVRTGNVDETRSDRTASDAHTYRFQTAILATNRQINDEASKIFRLNHFIIVSAVWPGFMYTCHTWGLPIVTENQEQKKQFAARGLCPVCLPLY